jgi:hypothetical protein
MKSNFLNDRFDDESINARFNTSKHNKTEVQKNL